LLDNTILVNATLANAIILPICNNASFYYLAGSFGVSRLALLNRHGRLRRTLARHVGT
jgi:hypothetical protein